MCSRQYFFGMYDSPVKINHCFTSPRKAFDLPVPQFRIDDHGSEPRRVDHLFPRFYTKPSLEGLGCWTAQLDVGRPGSIPQFVREFPQEVYQLFPRVPMT